MITDILIYQITLNQSVPFLIFFKKKKNITYRLHYRVDEDRIWFSKWEGDRLCYEHHTKNNLTNSIKILEGISKRIVHLQSACNYDYQLFDLRKENEFLFGLVQEIGKDVERKSITIDREESKPKVRGMLLPGAE